jgi:flagellar L-ring protein precursor FlgH
MKNKIFLLVVMIFYVGCGLDPEINMDTPPKLQIPKKPKIIKLNKGSLYSKQGSSLFSDKKDLQIGDILQVVIKESLDNSSKGSRSTTGANSTSLGGGLITPMDGITLKAPTKTIADKINPIFGASFKTESTNTFKGSFGSKFNENFNATVSVIIEQTYQNGNYFVRGSKEMLIDGQKQILAVSGIIRPYDITPDNTVFSHQLANLKIKFVKLGEENDANHKSWGSKIIDKVWPF